MAKWVEITADHNDFFDPPTPNHRAFSKGDKANVPDAMADRLIEAKVAKLTKEPSAEEKAEIKNPPVDENAAPNAARQA